MPGGLVEPEVDRDHRVQRRQRLVELVSGGRGQHRVARDGDQRLDLTLARCRDLLGQARHRHLAENFLGAADPGAVSAELGCAVLQARDRLHGDRPRRRQREHAAAGGVEVAGEDVDHVDEPAGQAAEFLIHRCRFGRTPLRVSCAASSRASARIRSASIPVTRATRSGDHSAATSRMRSDAVDVRLEVTDGRPGPRRTACARRPAAARRRCPV